MRLCLVLAAALTLGGCMHDGQPDMASQPRGATVAFDSIDGLPPGQFKTLVQNLNDEAQRRRLSVMSRESPAAYRVRGYIAAKVVKGQTTISWVWDVFDQEEQRALRITGAAPSTGKHANGWNAADDGMLRQIASTSVEQLATFLTSPEVAPGADAQVASLGMRDSSPESAGIFRIFHANADPLASERPDITATAASNNGRVPLPRRRPATEAAATPGTLMLAASQ